MYKVFIPVKKQDFPLALELFMTMSRHCFGNFKEYNGERILIEIPDDPSFIVRFTELVKKHNYTISLLMFNDTTIYDASNKITLTTDKKVDQYLNQVLSQ